MLKLCTTMYYIVQLPIICKQNVQKGVQQCAFQYIQQCVQQYVQQCVQQYVQQFVQKCVQ